MAMARPTFEMYYSEVAGYWMAGVSNTIGVQYHFFSRQAAQRLANAMRAGRQTAIDLIEQGQIFTDRIDGDFIFDTLFNTTRSGTFGFGATTPFYSDADVTIAQNLDEFADAWETVLFFAAARTKIAPALMQSLLQTAQTTPGGREVGSKVQNSVGSPPSGAFSIGFSNYSSSRFDRTELSVPPSEGGFVTINTEPSTVLNAMDGSESLTWTEVFPNWSIGKYTAKLAWGMAGLKFGIELHVPFQEFHIGTSPYWKYYVQNSGWKEPHSAGTPVVVQTKSDAGDTYTIRVDPQASGTALILAASIQGGPLPPAADDA